MDGYSKNATDFWRIMGQAQTVMAYRTFGMMGMWPVKSSENDRMVSEKLPAFIEAWNAAVMAAMTGKSPDKIIDAWLKPIGSKTSSNQKRLSGSR